MKVNKREIYRYLGYKGQLPDDCTANMIDEITDILQTKCQVQNVQRTFLCNISDDTVILYDSVNELSIHSRQLADNLKNCSHVVLFAATLGSVPDMLVRKYEIMNMAKAAIVQASAAACIEAYCNEIQEQVRVYWKEQGMYLRPRFSPGYGDLPLSLQKDFFALLSCEKRIGVTLTDTYMMLPTKSVTALIGVTADSDHCHVGKCKNCMKKDCEFRDEDSE